MVAPPRRLPVQDRPREQFALAEVIGQLRAVRRSDPKGELIGIARATRSAGLRWAVDPAVFGSVLHHQNAVAQRQPASVVPRHGDRRALLRVCPSDERAVRAQVRAAHERPIRIEFDPLARLTCTLPAADNGISSPVAGDDGQAEKQGEQEKL